MKLAALHQRPKTVDARAGRTASAITRTMPIDQLPAFLTIHEVAIYLNVGRSTAYQWAQSRGVRVGRLLRVPRENLPR